MRLLGKCRYRISSKSGTAPGLSSRLHMASMQEWTTPQPSKRPDTQPEFEKLETPLPKRMPGDPEQPDEEEEEEREKKKREQPDEDDPDKEEGEEEEEEEVIPEKEKGPRPEREKSPKTFSWWSFHVR